LEVIFTLHLTENIQKALFVFNVLRGHFEHDGCITLHHPTMKLFYELSWYQ